MEEEMEEALASSESTSPSPFRIKKKGHERVTGQGQPYQWQ